MKVLIVSFWFPPANVVGAIRVGKLARYLDRHGHEVRVLTTNIGGDQSLPLEIPIEQVIYTEYRQRRDRLAHLGRSFRRRTAAALGVSGETSLAEGNRPSKPAWDWLQRQYYALVHIPDMRSDWIKTAIPAGRQLVEEWRPDVIFRQRAAIHRADRRGSPQPSLRHPMGCRLSRPLGRQSILRLQRTRLAQAG